MALMSGVLETCAHALETYEPSCMGRLAKPFFILKACSPLMVMGHVAVSEPC
jgi:hypothetical protein